MFDVDGTFTRIDEVDGDGYVQALKDVFDFDAIDDDWSTYAHTTDSGIIDESSRGA